MMRAKNPHNWIMVRGAEENNLQKIDVDIPKNKLVLITGVSGSGKSSLAFDTLFAEGQRRYVESLSPYARLFIEQASRPRVESIEGLPPSIAVEHRAGPGNPRSTVGTVTGIHDHLRLLYAHLGVLFCPGCGRGISSHSIEQITDTVSTLGDEPWVRLQAPLVNREKGGHKDVLAMVQRQGFLRVEIDGRIYDLDNGIPDLASGEKHSIEVVVDRFRVHPDELERLNDGIELALKVGKGQIAVLYGDNERMVFSSTFGCPDCGLDFQEISPRSFSFNSPAGACPECQGIGRVYQVDEEFVLPRTRRLTLEQCLDAWTACLGRRPLMGFLKELRRRGVDPAVPTADLPEKTRRWIVTGGSRKRGGFKGIHVLLTDRYRRAKSAGIRDKLKRYVGDRVCPSCDGKRLNQTSLAVRFRGRNIADMSSLPIMELDDFFRGLRLGSREREVCGLVVHEISSRLDFLRKVGVGYLSLAREVGTLSGGEFQRIRLAGQLGSRLTGVLYVLDEPSVGLHPQDQRNLLNTLLELRDLSNTVLVVEHDRDTILHADHLVDLGPGAGKQGGNVIFSGSVKALLKSCESLTARYLKASGLRPEHPGPGRPPDRGTIRLIGAREHNLKNIEVAFPLGLLTCVTGVSGSGKSTLVLDTLYRTVARELHNFKTARPGKHDRLEGIAEVDRIIAVDAAPIGRTSRSNPATYSRVFNDIRKLFSMTRGARERGYGPGRFSFNVAGGRCEACSGEGVCRVEMQFMPDVFVTCEVCGGARYNRETLAVKYRGVSIADVLSMTVDEGLRFFQDVPSVRRRLDMLRSVGLGYLEIGQPAPSLSAGEVQRLKLSRELARRSRGRSLYILDEPTTGLHFADIEILLNVLRNLVNRGETVIIVEHNIDIVLEADHVIDLGPGGGADGGRLLGAGTPEEIATIDESVTGRFIREALELT